MTLETPSWRDSFGEIAPEMLKQITTLQTQVTEDGALSLKTKTLMMILSDALLSHPNGVVTHATRARNLGATEQEIAETVAVAFLMGGMPGLVTGANAFKK